LADSPVIGDGFFDIVEVLNDFLRQMRGQHAGFFDVGAQALEQLTSKD
jgi:hypothetical protein